MPEYVDLELLSDPEVMGQDGKDYLEEHLDGYVSRPANVETVLIESSAYMEAEVIEQASVVTPFLFAWLGRSLYGIAPYEATPSSGSADITFSPDVSATMLVQGTLLVIPHPSGEQMLFGTDADIVAPVGGGVVRVGITAEEPGTQANGCFGDAQLIETVDDVTGVRVDAATAGGVDPEDEDAYLDRLASALTLLSPRPILPQDFALLALQDPRVERAMAMDLFQPPASFNGVGGPPWGAEPNGTQNVPRCVTVAIKPTGGDVPSSTLMQEIWAGLDAMREVNFLTYVIPPKISAVDVKMRVKPVPGIPFATAQQAAADSLAAWLNPATWGPQGTGDDWLVDNVVRINEAIDWANRAEGVWWVDQVQLKLSTDATWSSADVVLPGPAPLATAGTILPNITAAP